MSATNLTKNLKLSQFVASDKPSWLGDVNGDNKKIDDGFGVLTGEISKANDTASSAKSQSDANTQTLTNVNSELEDYGNRITALEAGGGTEQLEQRVNTLGTDVEALQTRADTFEENISQNGTDITALKGRVDTIEPKVNTNAENITSLQSSNSSILSQIEEQSNLISNAQTTATNAKNTADSTKAQVNILNSTVTSLNNTVNDLTGNSISVTTSSFNGNRSFIQYASDIQMFVSNNTIYFNMITITLLNKLSTTEYTALGTFELPSVVNNVLAGSGSEYISHGQFLGANVNVDTTFYIETSGQTATLYGKTTTTATNAQAAIGLLLGQLSFE